MSIKKGLFITFEGADGSGKTTQLNKVSEYLKSKNICYIITREPGGSQLSNQLRDILLNYKGTMATFCELFLYLADRAQHVEETIIPALNAGKIVLCDRYIDSTVAYQGYARGLNIDEIINLNNLVTNSLLPDLTILCDVETSVAMGRVGDTKDRLESEAAHFHERVRNGYLELAKINSDRIKVVDANKDIETVYQDIIVLVDSIFK